MHCYKIIFFYFFFVAFEYVKVFATICTNTNKLITNGKQTIKFMIIHYSKIWPYYMSLSVRPIYIVWN